MIQTLICQLICTSWNFKIKLHVCCSVQSWVNFKGWNSYYVNIDYSFKLCNETRMVVTKLADYFLEIDSKNIVDSIQSDIAIRVDVFICKIEGITFFFLNHFANQ